MTKEDMDFQMSRIPERYKNVSYEKDVPADVKKSFDKMKEERKGIYIHGDVGTGKTHIAYALFAEFPKFKIKSKLYNTTELFYKLRRDFDLPYGEKDNVYDELLDFGGLVILDDIGAEKPSEWIAEQFYLLINSRYNRMIPTIFTSNLSLSQLSEKIGERVASRIAEMCTVIKINGDDRRV